MKTIDYERYIFRITVQERDESFESFIERLQIQLRKCRFADNDMHLKDQIIEKCQSKELRQRAFEHNMSLRQLIFTGRTLDSADRNFSRDRRDRDSHREPREQVRRPFVRDDQHKCTRCGFHDHDQNFHNCPAKRGFCENCKKPGHFKRMCNSYPWPPIRIRSRSPIDRARKTPKRDFQPTVAKLERLSPSIKDSKLEQNYANPPKVSSEPNNHDPRRYERSRSDEAYQKSTSQSENAFDISPKVAINNAAGYQKPDLSDSKSIEQAYQQHSAAIASQSYQNPTSNESSLQKVENTVPSSQNSSTSDKSYQKVEDSTVAGGNKLPTLTIKNICSLAKEPQKIMSPSSPVAPIYFHIHPE